MYACFLLSGILAAGTCNFLYHVEAWAHVGCYEFYPAIRAYSLEGLLPSLAISHLEFCNFVVILDLLLLDSFILAPLRLPCSCWKDCHFPLRPLPLCGRIEEDLHGSITWWHPCWGHWNLLFIGWQFLVSTLAAVFEEELDKTVHWPKYFGSKGVVGSNSIFFRWCCVFLQYLPQILWAGLLGCSCCYRRSLMHAQMRGADRRWSGNLGGQWPWSLPMILLPPCSSWDFLQLRRIFRWGGSGSCFCLLWLLSFHWTRWGRKVLELTCGFL